MDPYERIRESLSKNLPRKEDRDLLGVLLAAMKNGSKEDAETKIEDLIDNVLGGSK